jgi:multidrug efflux system membrane fusion protein
MARWCKTRVLGAAALTGLLLAGSALPARQTIAQAAAPLPMQVRVAVPQAAESMQPFRFNVRLAPFEEAMLYARANGYVDEWLVDIGEPVAAGQVLARLTLPELEEQIHQVEAEIHSQDAEVALAKLQRDRVASLVSSGHVSENERDQSVANYAVAEARRESLRARLAQLQREFAYTEVVAPFDGVITQRSINRGDRISVNDTRPLFRLVDARRLRLVIDVPQLQLVYLDLTQPAYLEFNDRPGQRLPAEFWRKADEIGLSSGTMRVEYLLDNAGHALPAGMSGYLVVSTQRDKALVLPVNTLQVNDGGAQVLTVAADGTLVRRAVTAGRYTGTQVEILAGLDGSERVVISPNALLRVGDRVEVIGSP